MIERLRLKVLKYHETTLYNLNINTAKIKLILSPFQQKSYLKKELDTWMRNLSRI